MSNKLTQEPPDARAPRYTMAWVIVLSLMPLTNLLDAVGDGGALRTLMVAVSSWTVVTVVTALVAVALHRIITNVRWHRRPFTDKDYWYCLRAFYAAMFGATFLVLYSLVDLFVMGEDDQSRGLSDTVSVQVMYLLVVAAILNTLAYAHRKGAALYEELEKGV